MGRRALGPGELVPGAQRGRRAAAAAREARRAAVGRAGGSVAPPALPALARRVGRPRGDEDRALAAVDGTTLSLTDGAGAHHTAGGYDVVVGADGLRSNLRAQLVDDGDPRDAGRTIWRAVIPFTPALRRVLSENACSMSAGSGKVGFLTDIGDDLLYSASSDGRVFSRERRPKM